VIVYDIIFKITNKKHKHTVTYSTFQLYNSFKLLNERLSTLLADPSADGSNAPTRSKIITYPFPLVTTSVAIFGLSDTALSERTRNLDAWFREVCTHYRSMPAQAKAAVREFLNFDMTRPKDIFVQDQLTWGTIETLADAPPSSVLITTRSGLNVSGDEHIDKESVSAGTAVVDQMLADNGRLRQSLYAASDAGGNRMSMILPSRRDSAGVTMWETQSSATARK